MAMDATSALPTVKSCKHAPNLAQSASLHYWDLTVTQGVVTQGVVTQGVVTYGVVTCCTERWQSGRCPGW